MMRWWWSEETDFMMGSVLIAVLLACLWCPLTAESITRLGLFHTQEEVWCWRQRAGLDANGTHGINCRPSGAGVYKSDGDVSTNSPGDWDRIVQNRADFHADPSSGRWSAVPTSLDSSGCVPDSTDGTDGPRWYGWPEGQSAEGGNDFNPWATRLRDAAFWTLVTGDTTDVAAIKTELLWMMGQSWADFTNASLWCFQRSYDIAPSFGITSIFTRLLFAVEYIGRSAFTSGELAIVDRWFFDSADYWRGDVDNSQDEKFSDRWAGDFTPTEACTDPIDPYQGGPDILSYARFNNNRRGAILRYAMLVGVYLQQAGVSYTNGRMGTSDDLVLSGKQFVHEALMFTVYPEGFVGEFERRGDGGNPEQGWGYSGASIGELMEFADALARAGDTSLYTYSTAAGLCGTSGTINDGGSRVGENKDIKFVLTSYLKYITDQYARYWPDNSTIDNRIDGRYPRNGTTWSGCHDTNTALANTYFQDTFIKQAYTRTHANSFPYQTGDTCGSANFPWQGENSIFPGILFMFGNLEGIVGLGQGADPYALSAASSVPVLVRVVPIP